MPARGLIPKRAPPREHRHTHGINEHDSVATGVQLDELVSGGETTLHKHIVTEDLLAGLVTEVTADLVLTDAYYILAVDCSQGAVRIYLPAANAYTNKTYVIKKMDASTNPVIVIAAGNDEIDGQVQFIINDQYNAMEIRTAGSADWLNI
jgi:hypothetical protein